MYVYSRAAPRSAARCSLLGDTLSKASCARVLGIRLPWLFLCVNLVYYILRVLENKKAL
jgi:hypothetical protein